MAAIVIGAVLLAFPMVAAAEAPDYSDFIGAEKCKDCHEENYNDWHRSGHPYKLMKSEEARNRGGQPGIILRKTSTGTSN